MSELLKLIKEVGIYRLAGTDGCLCMHCKLHNVSIDIQCRKSTWGWDEIDENFYGVKLRVFSPSLEDRRSELLDIAKEVCRQLKGEGYPIKVRFCDGEQDKNCKCTYCGKERSDKGGYLCEKCLTGKDAFGDKIADTHDLRSFDFVCVIDDSKKPEISGLVG